MVQKKYKRVNVWSCPDEKDNEGLWIKSRGKVDGDIYYRYTSRSYGLWCSINLRSSGKYPSYANVTNDFECFDEFADWCQTQEGYWNKDEKGKFWCLDKDLKDLSNRSYSTDTCLFIPQRINNLLKFKSSGEYPLGVCYITTRDKIVAAIGQSKRSSKFLGYFEEPMQAHRAWQLAKIEKFNREINSTDLTETIKHYLTVLRDKIQMDVNNEKETIFEEVYH